MTALVKGEGKKSLGRFFTSGIFTASSTEKSIEVSLRKEITDPITPSIFLAHLTQFSPMFQFYTPLKHQKTFSFLMLSGGIDMKH